MSEFKVGKGWVVFLFFVVVALIGLSVYAETAQAQTWNGNTVTLNILTNRSDWWDNFNFPDPRCFFLNGTRMDFNQSACGGNSSGGSGGSAKWNIDTYWIINVSGNLTLNETSLNTSIDLRTLLDNDTAKWSINVRYIVNSSGNLSLNLSTLNESIKNYTYYLNTVWVTDYTLINKTGSLSVNETYINNTCVLVVGRPNPFNQVLNTTSNVSFTNFTGDWIADGNGHFLHLYTNDNDLILNASNVIGNNYFGIKVGGVQGGEMKLYSNPNAGNGYLLWGVSEIQGADTYINVYEGGTTHNRFWSSGSVRIGGGESYLCTNLTSVVDCNTPLTGADLVVQDDIWQGGSLWTKYINSSKINTTQINNTGTTTSLISRAREFMGRMAGSKNLSCDDIGCVVNSALDLFIGGFEGSLTHANTDDRIYTLPDKTGTIALTIDLIPNETARFDNLTNSDCPFGWVMNGVYNNGSRSCVKDTNESLRIDVIERQPVVTWASSSFFITNQSIINFSEDFNVVRTLQSTLNIELVDVYLVEGENLNLTPNNLSADVIRANTFRGNGGGSQNMTCDNVGCVFSGDIDVSGSIIQAIDGWEGEFTHANSADRLYTFPDKDGTVAMLDDIGAEWSANQNLNTTANVSFNSAVFTVNTTTNVSYAETFKGINTTRTAQVGDFLFNGTCWIIRGKTTTREVC